MHANGRQNYLSQRAPATIDIYNNENKQYKNKQNGWYQNLIEKKDKKGEKLQNSSIFLFVQ